MTAHIKGQNKDYNIHNFKSEFDGEIRRFHGAEFHNPKIGVMALWEVFIIKLLQENYKDFEKDIKSINFLNNVEVLFSDSSSSMYDYSELHTNLILNCDNAEKDTSFKNIVLSNQRTNMKKWSNIEEHFNYLIKSLTEDERSHSWSKSRKSIVVNFNIVYRKNGKDIECFDYDSIKAELPGLFEANRNLIDKTTGSFEILKEFVRENTTIKSEVLSDFRILSEDKVDEFKAKPSVDSMLMWDVIRWSDELFPILASISGKPENDKKLYILEKSINNPPVKFSKGLYSKLILGAASPEATDYLDKKGYLDNLKSDASDLNYSEPIIQGNEVRLLLDIDKFMLNKIIKKNSDSLISSNLNTLEFVIGDKSRSSLYNNNRDTVEKVMENINEYGIIPFDLNGVCVLDGSGVLAVDLTLKHENYGVSSEKVVELISSVIEKMWDKTTDAVTIVPHIYLPQKIKEAPGNVSEIINETFVLFKKEMLDAKLDSGNPSVEPSEQFKL